MLRCADDPAVRLSNHDNRILSTSDLELCSMNFIGNIIMSVYFDIRDAPDLFKLLQNSDAGLIISIV